MMDGRNCTGRTISLLNDSGDVVGVPAPAAKLDHLHRHHHQHHHHNNNTLPSPQPLLEQHPLPSAVHHHHHHRHHQQQQASYYQPRDPVRLPPLGAHRTSSSTSVVTTHSRDSSSSAASTPASEPQTPLLVRSSSSDSRAYSTPSPLTPGCNTFDHAAAAAANRNNNNSHHHQHQQHRRTPPQQHYYLNRPNPQHQAKMDDPTIAASLYPPIPDATLPMPAVYQLTPQMPSLSMQPTQITDSSNSPSSEPSHVSGVSNGSSSKKHTPKKNQYPCPMAKQFGCNDYFTTSGHAARHAKKHTGKKDAFCPECNKAFTRKDNMEQHRRTHQNGRGTGSRSGNDDAKVKKSTKPSSKKSSAVKAEPQQLEAAVEQQLAEPSQQPQPIAPSTSQMPLAINPTQVAPNPPMVPQTLQPQSVDSILLQSQQQQQQPSGPYFLSTIDTGPIPSLPNISPDLNMRPTLHRSSFANSLDYVPPLGPMMGGGLDAMDALHFSYPSPGLSNGLNSLALAASEHRRLSEEKSASSRASPPMSGERSPVAAAAARDGVAADAVAAARQEAQETPLQETP